MGASLNRTSDFADMSFYLGSFYNKKPHLENPMSPVASYERNNLVGSALNIPLSNFLLKFETTYLTDLKFNYLDKKFDRLDFLLGTEYRGITDLVLSFEMVNRHLFSYEESIMTYSEIRDDELQNVLRINYNLFNDQLKIVFLNSFFGGLGEDGSLQRLSFEYDYNDFTNIMIGLMSYQTGKKSQLKKIQQNDQIFVDYRLSF
jgi:hypothetical protein